MCYLSFFYFDNFIKYFIGSGAIPLIIGGHPIHPLSFTFFAVASFFTVSKSPFLQALHNRERGNNQVLLAVKFENKFIET